jgi:hypothetical protein
LVVKEDVDFTVSFQPGNGIDRYSLHVISPKSCAA